MANVLNLLSEDAYVEQMGRQNALLAAIASNTGGVQPASWADVQRIVRMGLAGQVFTVGDQLVCNHETYGALTWDVIGIDHDTPTDKTKTHSLTLQLHDVLHTMQCDAPEALYYAESELPAGTYHFALQAGYDTAYGGGKTYSFTLTNAVPAGGVILFPWAYQKQAADTKISTYESRAAATAIETVAVTEGTGGTALTNTNNTHRIRYGSNGWRESAVRQYLNSAAEKGRVWTPQTDFDRAPSWANDQAGFLNGLDADFAAVIGEVDKVTARNTVTDGGDSETTAEKVFLLSRAEVRGGDENGMAEGAPYAYYVSTAERIKYLSGKTQDWWLRSPLATNPHHVRGVTTTGTVGMYNAQYSIGVTPAVCIV